MVTEAELLAVVDEAFEDTGRGLAAWPDPHAGRSPLDDEYSRVADPGKWRILGARADAWLRALAVTGVAVVERAATVRWRSTPATVVSWADRAVPNAVGALPLVLARSRIDDAEGVGVTFGVGDPAVCVGWVPDCGCDACDFGSQPELDLVDMWARAVVLGTFRLLASGGRQVAVFGDGRWNTTGPITEDVPSLLAAPGPGWEDVSGPSWLG